MTRTEEVVRHVVALRIEYLQKILRITASYGDCEKRQRWQSELNTLKLWLDCRSLARAS